MRRSSLLICSALPSEEKMLTLTPGPLDSDARSLSDLVRSRRGASKPRPVGRSVFGNGIRPLSVFEKWANRLEGLGGKCA